MSSTSMSTYCTAISFLSVSAVIPALVKSASSSLKNRIKVRGLFMSTDGAPRSPRIGIGTGVGAGCWTVCGTVLDSAAPVIVAFDVFVTVIGCVRGFVDSGIIGTDRLETGDSSIDR